MSALGAFFRGAAGPGMLALADIYERRDREDKILQERRENLAAEQAFRAEQARLDRMARFGSDGSEPGMLAAGRRATSAGTAEGGGGSNMGDIGRVMQQTGMSEAQVRQAMQASASGQNPYTKTTVTNEGDRDTLDRRTGTGATTRVDPDEERWVSLNKMLGKVWSESGPRAKSNYEQLTAGDGNAQRNQIVGGMLSGGLTPAETGEAVAATKGEGAYGKGNVNQFSGTPDAIGRSEIRENDAQAGSAGRANRDGGGGDPLAKLPAAVQATVKQLDARDKEITQAITKAQAEVGGWDPAANPGQAALQAELAAVRIRQRQVLAPYLPKQEGAPAGDDPLGLGIGKPKDEAKPADAPKAAKPEPKKAAEPADPIRLMSERDLKRIAAIEGHANQEKAKAELKRRQEAKADDSSAPTDASGMLNLGA